MQVKQLCIVVVYFGSDIENVDMLLYTRDSFNAHWMKAKKKAEELHPDLSFDFTFHDLKAKGISDLDGNLYKKQAIFGHKNVTQTARYDRKIAVVPVVGGQNMAK